MSRGQGQTAEGILYGDQRLRTIEPNRLFYSDMELCEMILCTLEDLPPLHSTRQAALGKCQQTYKALAGGHDISEQLRYLTVALMAPNMPQGELEHITEPWPLECKNCEADLSIIGSRFILNETGCYCLPCLIGAERTKLIEDADGCRLWLQERLAD